MDAEAAHPLTEREIDLLRAGGLNPQPGSGPDPLAATTVALAALIQSSLSTAEAAIQLGVHASRIRRMLNVGTLYGFQVDGRWKIPSFQFVDASLIPNIEKVLAAMDRTLHPVAICRWFTSPDPDLEVGGVALSPLAWLRGGYKLEAVRDIAAEL